MQIATERLILRKPRLEDAAALALALRDYGVVECGFTRLVSVIQHSNQRSVRVAEKIGETYERDIVPWGAPRMLYALGA
jgi:RimJ/RimL family protein N-acetyltransferase